MMDYSGEERSDRLFGEVERTGIDAHGLTVLVNVACVRVSALRAPVRTFRHCHLTFGQSSVRRAVV